MNERRYIMFKKTSIAIVGIMAVAGFTFLAFDNTISAKAAEKASGNVNVEVISMQDTDDKHEEVIKLTDEEK